MWDVVSLKDALLEDVDSPRLVVDACPACHRRARLVERGVARESDGLTLPWSEKSPQQRVLQCEKCKTCFALPELGLPAWSEKPEEREKNLKLANLRARWTVVTQEVARWRKRSDLAGRHGDVALAEEARRVAARYEGEGHALRAEIERLGGELPKPPAPDPHDQKLDDELAVLREKAAAKKAARDDLTAQGDSVPPGDGEKPEAEASPEEAPTTEDDELAALKRKVGRKETPLAGAPPGTPPSDEDEISALKRKLKGKN